MGEWKDDKIEGKGTKYYVNGRKEAGTWKNGVFLGQPSYDDESHYFGKKSNNKLNMMHRGTIYFACENKTVLKYLQFCYMSDKESS